MELTTQELIRYEKGTLERKAHMYEIALLEAEQKETQLAKDICDLKLKVSSFKITKRREAASEFQKSHQKFNESVCERLGIASNKFAYDPITGEVDAIIEKESE